ncbi:hypothetical protein [Spirosoma koreense]
MHIFTSKRLIASWAVFFIFILFSDSCTILTDHTTPPPITGVGFQLSKSAAAPLEVLTVTLDEPSDNNMLDAKLGTMAVSLRQIDSKTYSFLIPDDVTPGTYALSISNSSKTVSLLVKEKPVIVNPTAYVQDYVKQAMDQFEESKALEDSLIKHNLISATANAQDRQSIQEKLNTAGAQFNALSAKDQKAYVQFIAANRSTLDSLNQLLAEFGQLAPLANGRQAVNCPLGIRDEYAQCAMVRLAFLAYFTASSWAAIAVGLETLDLPLVLLGSATLVIAARQLYDLLLYNLALFLIYADLTSIVLEPKSSVTIPKPARKAAGAEFKNGIARTITYRIPLRNVQEEQDKNSPNQTIRNFVASIQKLRSIFNGRLGDFIGVKFDFLPLKQGYILPESALKLSVTVLNNPNVTAKISGFNQGLFDLTFSTNAKSNQTFDYKVSYQYGDTKVEQIASGNQLSVDSQTADYYYTVQFNGNTYTFPSVYAQYIGGRFDIVGDADKLQTAIFFYPASLAVRGPSINKFLYHCTTTPDQPDKYVLGAHLYDFNTQRAIETTYSRGAIYGCDASQPDDNATPGQLVITQNDGSVVEGTFEYTDYISKQPVQGKFRVPIR